MINGWLILNIVIGVTVANSLTPVIRRPFLKRTASPFCIDLPARESTH